MIDNTCASPALVRPIEWGADIVVNSATKFLGGHGTSIGGVIVDAGKFDWTASGRFKEFTEPDPSYHGLSLYRGVRAAGLHSQGARTGAARHRGGFVALQRLSVLAGDRNAAPAHAAALGERAGGGAGTWKSIPAWSGSIIPGLESSQYYARAQKYLPVGQSGSLVTFGIKGGYEAGKKLINSLELFSPAGQHWRCQVAGDSSGFDHAPAALRGGAGGYRGHAGDWCGFRWASRTCATSSPT